MGHLLAKSSIQPIIINTRPVERAAPLTEHLQAAGFTVVDMPMLALQDCAITATETAIMQAWLAGEYQALIMVSPTAAASGLAMWQALSLDADAKNKKLTSQRQAPSHMIAVGSATAKVLEQAELPTDSYEIRQPTIANNEGMLAMPEIEQLQAGDKLLVWRGLGGRRLLVDTLQARGVIIDSIAWYERVMPDSAFTEYLQWRQKRLSSKSILPKPIVIISSGSTFENWRQVVAQAASDIANGAVNQPTITNSNIPKLADFVYIVLGVRLADMLAEQQLDYIQVEDLLPTTILAAICNAD